MRTKTAFLGAFVQPETLKQLDAFRGEVPRSRVIERAVNQYLQASSKKLQGPQISTPAAQAAPTTITPTNPTHTGTPTADRLSNMTTDDGARRLGGVEAVDVNRKKVNSFV